MTADAIFRTDESVPQWSGRSFAVDEVETALQHIESEVDEAFLVSVNWVSISPLPGDSAIR